jgi:lysophospholipid hydrolase
MSFAAFVPPLCLDGDLLMDGCYSSNLPVSYAATKLNADVIFAIDVATRMKLPPLEYGATFSAWQMIYRRWNPGPKDPPRYSEIIDLLTNAVAAADLNVTKTMPGCHYIHMPVEKYDLVAFDKFEEIFDIGYREGNGWLDQLEAKGILDGLAILRNDNPDKIAVRA